MKEDFKINNIDKWTVKPKEDGYKSPIKMVVEDVNIKIENDIIKAVQNYDIHVDREELAKALAYDRNQYDKGFADARKQYERPQGKWIVDEDNVFLNSKKCSNCNEGAEWLDGGSQFLSNYCPNCGARMQKGGAE